MSLLPDIQSGIMNVFLEHGSSLPVPAIIRHLKEKGFEMKEIKLLESIQNLPMNQMFRTKRQGNVSIVYLSPMASSNLVWIIRQLRLILNFL